MTKRRVFSLHREPRNDLCRAVIDLGAQVETAAAAGISIESKATTATLRPRTRQTASTEPGRGELTASRQPHGRAVFLATPGVACRPWLAALGSNAVEGLTKSPRLAQALGAEAYRRAHQLVLGQDQLQLVGAGGMGAFDHGEDRGGGEFERGFHFVCA